MTRFNDLTSREKAIEVVRWLCVLPAALLASSLTQFIFGLTIRTIFRDAGVAVDDSQVAYYLGMCLYHVPWGFVLVVAGARMAPRHQFAAAFVLTVLGVVLSLLTHLVGQYLAGNRVGVVNYAHFAAESAGALAGAAMVFCLQWRNRQARESV